MEGVSGQLTQSQHHNLETVDLSTETEPVAPAAILQLTPLFPKIFTANREISVVNHLL